MDNEFPKPEDQAPAPGGAPTPPTPADAAPAAAGPEASPPTPAPEAASPAPGTDEAAPAAKPPDAPPETKPADAAAPPKPAETPGTPLSPEAAARAAAPTAAMRTRARPPDTSHRLKRRLVWGILLSIAVLLGLGVYKYVSIMGSRKRMNAREIWTSTFQAAARARAEILRVEQKAWADNAEVPRPLSAEDGTRLARQIRELEECAEDLSRLMAIILDKYRSGNAQEAVDIPPRLFQVKFWLLDACGVAEAMADPVKPAGFFIPLNVTMNRWNRLRGELAQVEKARADILQRNDAGEKKTTVARLEELLGQLRTAAEAFVQLDDYVRGGMAREADGIETRELPDLAVPRDEYVRVKKAVGGVRQLMADLDAGKAAELRSEAEKALPPFLEKYARIKEDKAQYAKDAAALADEAASFRDLYGNIKPYGDKLAEILAEIKAFQESPKKAPESPAPPGEPPKAAPEGMKGPGADSGGERKAP